MDPQFHCKLPQRVREVRQQTQLNGIEFLEVASVDQLKLRVAFVHPLPDTGAAGEVPPGGAKLTPLNFRVEGGVRVTGIRVLAALTLGDAVTLTVSARGDFSTYTLRLVTSDTSDAVPAGYDPRLASIEFSFKANCPSEFDCADQPACPPEPLAEPSIQYLAKDYASFRRVMLDRLSVLLPDWRDRSPADPLVTLVETLAYTADQLSYWQDAVVTEAYLGTARKRVSLRRHARLLDYRMHDGCNARTWLQLEVTSAADGKVLPAGEVVLTKGGDGQAVLTSAVALERALRERPVVFGTLHDVTLSSVHNAVQFHTWSDAQCCLPQGATRATLRNQPALSLKPGDWLLLEEVIGPKTGNPADADREHRQVVRLTEAVAGTDLLTGDAILEVSWCEADALRFPLCISAEGVTGFISVARGNVVLADHGQWIGPEPLQLESVGADRPPRAQLAEKGVTFAVPFSPAQFTEESLSLSLSPAQRTTNSFLTGATALVGNPDQALPAVQLKSQGDIWTVRRELLASDRFAREFVVEMENDGVATLRFGDGVHGLRPSAEAAFTARYRIGGGQAGNVGADSLGRIRTDVPGIVGLRNPLPAAGGTDSEAAEAVRQFAPQAFRTQERAVTEADWVEVAQRHPEVHRAAAQFRWTGSWHTVFVTVDRRGGRPVEGDALFEQAMRQHLERYRLAGYDLEVNGPVFVPLDVKLTVCVKPGHFQALIKAALAERFSSRQLADGTLGFFHPDNLTFGQPVYLSQLVAEAMAVPGVHAAQVTRLQRFGKQPAGELAAGVIRGSPFEILRCDTDPNFPENGRIGFELEGGL